VDKFKELELALLRGKSLSFNGVMEIVSSYASDAYRTVYAIKLGKKIYVLHAFKKKSKKAIKTPKTEMEIIMQRLKQAKELAKEES
jgi:phage-related protein